MSLDVGQTNYVVVPTEDFVEAFVEEGLPVLVENLGEDLGSLLVELLVQTRNLEHFFLLVNVLEGIGLILHSVGDDVVFLRRDVDRRNLVPLLHLVRLVFEDFR